MPRYFFDYRDDVTIDDDVGTEITDLEAAREMAIGILKDLMHGSHQDGAMLEQEVIVRAEDGSHLFKVLLTLRCVSFV